MKYCSNCGAKLNENCDFCQNCGEKVDCLSKNNEKNRSIKNNQKGNNFLIYISILLIILALIFAGMASILESFIPKDNSKNENNTSNNYENNVEVDKTYVVYQDDDFLVKIIDYEYNSVFDEIMVKMYIENNSDIDTTFTIDGDVSIDEFMVDGGYFYQVVNAKKKATETFSLYNLKDKGVVGEEAKEMKFKFDIYQSSDYLINNRILDDELVNYEFK